jgi:hypothetical protein
LTEIISATISQAIGDLGGIAGRLPAASPEQRELTARLLERLAVEINEAAAMLRNMRGTSSSADA